MTRPTHLSPQLVQSLLGHPFPGMHPHLGLALLLLLVVPASVNQAQSLWGVNGIVKAIARLGNTIYVGGGFESAGPCTGGGVPVDIRTAAPCLPYPRVAGIVYSTEPDGRGGWFIAGQFIGVGGLPRTNLAHIRADGSVAPWAPRPNNVVTKLLLDRHTLYALGGFTEIGGQPRWYIAAFDARTGALTPWNPRANGEVYALALKGGTLFVGGDFDSIGGGIGVASPPWMPEPAW